MARLSLFINGTAYDVRPIDADGSAAIRAFRIRKFDGTEYDVAQTIDGPICDCPDFTFHREGIDPEGCKHVRALTACGLIHTPDSPVAGSSPEPVAPKPTEQDGGGGAGGPAPLAALVPANGQPTTFLEVVEHESMGYRAWGTAVGDFLGEQVGRIAQLIRWTGARTPADHEDRIESYEHELRARDYDRGYHDGLEAGRRETCPCGGHH
ncbi:MAG: hypothetical protein U0790_18005 [Isosphaeraceae bacterium]